MTRVCFRVPARLLDVPPLVGYQKASMSHASAYQTDHWKVSSVTKDNQILHLWHFCCAKGKWSTIPSAVRRQLDNVMPSFQV